MTERPVVVLGFFDGVHRGHRLLLEVARRFATDNGAGRRVVVVTLDTVPKIRGNLLCSLDDRVRLLRGADADRVIVVPFQAVRRLTPAAFLRQHIDPLRPLAVTVGAGFRFGCGRSGGIPELQRWCARRAAILLVVGEVRAAACDGTHRVSATRIRTLVASGHFADAGVLLGRPYEMGGPVVPGRGIGRRLGVPTINWRPTAGVLLPRGVMAGRLVIGRTSLPAVAYVGCRPTFADAGKLVGEVHIIGRRLPAVERVVFQPVVLLRGDRRFGSARELQRQMRRDIARARAVLRRLRAFRDSHQDREGAPCR